MIVVYLRANGDKSTLEDASEAYPPSPPYFDVTHGKERALFSKTRATYGARMVGTASSCARQPSCAAHMAARTRSPYSATALPCGWTPSSGKPSGNPSA